MIKILIVDDHKIVRDSLAQSLSAAYGYDVVGLAASGEESVNMVRAQQPNVVLMDLEMPGIGGAEASKRILRMAPNTKVVVLSVLQASPMPEELLSAGVSGYLSKSSSINEVQQAIEQARYGKRYVSHEIAQRLAFSTFGGNRSAFAKLSSRERQIALMIVRCCGIQKIAEMLSLSPKTVNSYRYRIFAKLNIFGDVQLAVFMIQHKIVNPYSIQLPCSTDLQLQVGKSASNVI